MDEKQLFQARENSTNAVSVYSPAADTNTVVKHLRVVNTSGGNADLTLYHDDDGTTYDESTAIEWQTTLATGETFEIDNTFIALNNSSGNLAYKSSVANALTITGWGTEIT